MKRIHVVVLVAGAGADGGRPLPHLHERPRGRAPASRRGEPRRRLGLHRRRARRLDPPPREPLRRAHDRRRAHVVRRGAERVELVRAVHAGLDVRRPLPGRVLPRAAGVPARVPGDEDRLLRRDHWLPVFTVGSAPHRPSSTTELRRLRRLPAERLPHLDSDTARSRSIERCHPRRGACPRWRPRSGC